MTIEIRKAVESEIEILLAFEQGIIEAERPFDPTLRDGGIHYYDLIDLIRSSGAEVLVAVVNNDVVGSGYARIQKAKPYLQFDQYAYLGFMFVKQDYRGFGINQMILEKLIEWSKTQGLCEVRLEVYDENLAARKAYQKAGFKPNMLEMRLGI